MTTELTTIANPSIFDKFKKGEKVEALDKIVNDEAHQQRLSPEQKVNLTLCI